MGKNLLIALQIICIVVLLYYIVVTKRSNPVYLNPLSTKLQQVSKPLVKYSFPSLKKRIYTSSTIEIGRKIAELPKSTSYMFYFKSDGKRISGLMNVPKSEGDHPVIILFRGFVDPKMYQTGIGSQHVGEALAAAGYITLAPDFIGYGESDHQPDMPLEERFMTYTTGLNLISAVSTLNQTLSQIEEGTISAELDKIGLWGHSNGGHIALSVLGISGQKIPTVVWAPVSKPFPFSILYFTDNVDDQGKALRKVVSDFEAVYDTELYSPPNYFDWIQGPVQIHQGEADPAVPQVWSDDLYAKLKETNKDVDYFTYPGNDHNLAQGAWQTAVDRMILFYQRLLK